MGAPPDPEPPYRPRETDHLVEPVFGGLGVGEEEREPEPARRGWWRRLLSWLSGR